MTLTDDHQLEVLLEFLKRERGFDFTGYKRASLARRIAKRMEAVGVEGYDGYLEHLELDGEEYGRLFDTILINVTGFFRDPAAWQVLSDRVLPDMLSRIDGEQPIRVWCAACASGEETYSIAMALVEALGEEAYSARVKIYATDADESALATARTGTYPAKALEALPPERVARFFDGVDGVRSFRKDLRRAIIFGRNDLVQDAPISRIDLLSCRNALMYFNAETQAGVLRRFHFALRETGVLFLGKSEMLTTHNALFRPLDIKHRVFSPIPVDVPGRTVTADLEALQLAGDAPHRNLALEASPVAQIVVDEAGTLVVANRAARRLFDVTAADVGRPLKDLALSYRPVDLHSNLEQAKAARRGHVLRDVVVESPTGDGRRDLEVHVAPLLAKTAVVGASVTFHDVTAERLLRSELATLKAELGNAYEELQSTVEELETTNEELQSTNEELETTNEELQATNEELETMNEELQSSNEELEAMNTELRGRACEVGELNTFLETILSAVELAVIAVDAKQLVRIWNDQAAELWGLRGDEVIGRPLLGLDIGLPLAELAAGLAAVLARRESRTVVQLEAVDRRGRTLDCRVTCLPLRGDQGPVTGAILLMDGSSSS
jgi:two-component system CheB/CheR fusion protein